MRDKLPHLRWALVAARCRRYRGQAHSALQLLVVRSRTGSCPQLDSRCRHRGSVGVRCGRSTHGRGFSDAMKPCWSRIRLHSQPCSLTRCCCPGRGTPTPRHTGFPHTGRHVTSPKPHCRELAATVLPREARSGCP